MLTRRNLLRGAAGLVAAPFVARAGVLMPVREIVVPRSPFDSWPLIHGHRVDPTLIAYMEAMITGMGVMHWGKVVHAWRLFIDR